MVCTNYTFLVRDSLYYIKRTIYALSVISVAGVVPRGGPKKSPRTTAIVQIIFYLWSFETNGIILRI